MTLRDILALVRRLVFSELGKGAHVARPHEGGTVYELNNNQRISGTIAPNELQESWVGLSDECKGTQEDLLG